MRSAIVFVAIITMLAGCNTVKGTFEGAGKDISGVTGGQKSSSSSSQSKSHYSNSSTNSQSSSSSY